ncbi:MAG TPA: NAD-binding protein [Planctomycetota bacterium]|nr:NAD-binding protein [Planctomycetota bacterium]
MDIVHSDATVSRLSVVIVGCGRLGSLAARRLYEAGSHVQVIDRSAASCGVLPPSLAAAARIGDPLLPDVLRAGGIDEADCCLAATENDTLNAAVAMMCSRLFCVGLTLACIADQPRARSYRRLGIDVLCTVELAAAKVVERIRQIAV